MPQNTLQDKEFRAEQKSTVLGLQLQSVKLKNPVTYMSITLLICQICPKFLLISVCFGYE